LIYITNNRGPSTDHWGTPAETLQSEEDDLFINGPLLFNMYINDIAEKLISLTRLFADDTSFSYSNRDELQIKTVIEHCKVKKTTCLLILSVVDLAGN
jgi:hypothetical protein